MHRLVASAIVLAVGLCIPRFVSAQSVETRTVKRFASVEVNKGPELLQLERYFVSGDISAARKKAAEILESALEAATENAATERITEVKTLTSEVNKSVVVVVWVGTTATDTPVIRRMLLKQNGDRQFTADLNGVRSLFEVFFASNQHAESMSTYVSTRVDNPITSQLPAFAEQIMMPLFAVVSMSAAKTPGQGGRPAVPAPRLYVTFSTVLLPYERATMSVTTTATLPIDVGGDAATKIQNAAKLAAATALFEAGVHSQTVSDYAFALPAKISAIARACAGGIADDSKPLPAHECLKEFEIMFTAAYTSASFTDNDKEPAAAVDEKMREFVTGLSRSANSTVSVNNTPPNHFSLASVVGVTFRQTANTDRVKLDEDNLYAADPLPRTLTLAVVNYSPWGYDSASFMPLSRERVQFFGGAVVLPDFGLGAGVSCLLVRGLAVNFGWVMMFSKGLPENDVIGQAPTDSSKPFALSVSNGLFVGGSFNFKVK